MTKFGTAISVAAGFFVPICVSWAMVTYGWSWGLFVFSILGGLFVAFMLKVVAELTQVIADMLLPNQ